MYTGRHHFIRYRHTYRYTYEGVLYIYPQHMEFLATFPHLKKEEEKVKRAIESYRTFPH